MRLILHAEVKKEKIALMHIFDMFRALLFRRNTPKINKCDGLKSLNAKIALYNVTVRK